MDAYEDFVEVNRRNYDAYAAHLNPLPGIKVFEHDGSRPHNFHYLVVEVDAEVAGLSRDELVAVLEAENVLARRYFYPGAHCMEPYLSDQPMAGLVLPQTNDLCTRVMTLPTGGNVDESSIAIIAAIVERALINAEDVRRQYLATGT